MVNLFMSAMKCIMHGTRTFVKQRNKSTISNAKPNFLFVCVKQNNKTTNKVQRIC